MLNQSQNQSRYQKWHSYSLHLFLHWTVLVAVLILMGICAQTYIINSVAAVSQTVVFAGNEIASDVEYAPENPPILSVAINQQAVAMEKQLQDRKIQEIAALADISRAFAQAEKQYNTTTGAAQQTALADLLKIAQQRKEKLLQILPLDPQSVARAAFPAEHKSQLPSQVQSFIESDVTVSGEYAEGHADDFANEKTVFFYGLTKSDGTFSVLYLLSSPSADINSGDSVDIQAIQLPDSSDFIVKNMSRRSTPIKIQKSPVSFYIPFGAIAKFIFDKLIPTVKASGLGVPAYSSLPGAAQTLYLDFDGNFTSIWGSYSNITTPAYDIDGDSLNFSVTELANIQKIWQQVAEDFAPLKINVTTVEPSSFADGVSLRNVIGGNSSWTGGTYGGISYVGSFTNSIANVAFIFSANLGNGYPKYVGDAASHEAGHAFGLNHQKQWNGSILTSEYYSGPGDGTAPIMGNSYSSTLSRWWYGTSTSANTYQNDMSILSNSTNKFGYRSDDYGDSISVATPLTMDGSGNISTTGIIGIMTDKDYFSFHSNGGVVSVTVSPAIASTGNLDINLQLFDGSGTMVASDDPTSLTSAAISYSAPSGNYYFVVSSHGLSANATPTNYGIDVGQYSLSGTIGTGTGDVTPPTAPASLVSSLITATSFTLSWAASSDNAGVSGYNIYKAGASIGTSTTTNYNVTGLTCATGYILTVAAYDASTNTSAQSDGLNVTTAACPVDTISPGVPSGLFASLIADTSLTLSWNASVDNVGVTGYKVFQNAAQVGTSAGTSFAVNSLTACTNYNFAVAAYDAAGNVSSLSSVLTAKTVGCVADIIPPVVTIISPLDGTTLAVKGVTSVNVGASDSSGISSINIYIDSTAKPVKTCTGTTTCSYNINNGRITKGTHVVLVKATDKALPSNTAMASIVITK